MSECDEVARVLLARCPPLQSLDAARVCVRTQMFPDESEVIIDNVAASLFRSYVAAHGPATDLPKGECIYCGADLDQEEHDPICPGRLAILRRQAD